MDMGEIVKQRVSALKNGQKPKFESNCLGTAIYILGYINYDTRINTTI